MSRFEYIRLADAVAADIAGGALKPGDRLPPQRTFAYERKIAASTASRVYTELLRRGLVVGEVGRGTFVSGESRHPIATLPHEPRAVRIDLEINYPMLPTQAAMIAKSLAGLERAEAIDIAQRQGSSGGTQAARNIAAGFMARPGWMPNSEQFAFTANGRQCIAAVLSALVPAGGRCGVEALTYPFIKGIAARLGITLVPLKSATIPPATHTNCIIVGEEDLFVIDPGADDAIERAHLNRQLDHLVEIGGRVAAVVLTHSHIDHTAAAEELRELLLDIENSEADGDVRIELDEHVDVAIRAKVVT